MKYYMIKPEVAGELGDNSKIIYEAGRIKEVTFLEFVFCDWLGDEILTARPCYMITKNLMDDFVTNGIRGVKYEDVQISFSEDFLEMYEDTSEMPAFVRLVPLNKVECFGEDMEDDIYADKCNRLIVSEKALEILKRHKIDHCDIEEVG